MQASPNIWEKKQESKCLAHTAPVVQLQKCVHFPTRWAGQRWQRTCGTKMKQLIVVVHTKMPPEVKPNSKLCQARKKR